MKLEQIEKLCDAATPPPWDFISTKSVNAQVGKTLNGPDTYEDAQFIAASRELMPKLLAVAKAAHCVVHVNPREAWVKDLAKALKNLEQGLDALRP